MKKSFSTFLQESANLFEDESMGKFVRQLKNPETGQLEYAFVNIYKTESDPHFVLKWFGAEKPSDDEVEKELRAVEYFKNNS
jgi:hypothetical protein